VPLENLDIHLGTPIVLDEDALLAKIVSRHRGGFCYELNGTFALLLADLGFPVTLLEARVYGADGEVTIDFDHLCLTVDLDETWLVDVGFGASFDEPLRLAPGVDQVDPAGTFRIEPRDDGWLDLLKDGDPQHRFFLEPRALADFTPGCEYNQYSPDSHFTQNTVCTLRTESGRVTVYSRTLAETIDGERSEQELEPDELQAVFRDRFGITLTEAEAARLAG
jgi:N-hydroxyarylamine O-acetyltransferase